VLFLNTATTQHFRALPTQKMPPAKRAPPIPFHRISRAAKTTPIAPDALTIFAGINFVGFT